MARDDGGRPAPARRGGWTSLLVAALLLGPGGPLGAAEEHADGSAIAQPPQTQTATFAGGCFWCMQPPFDRLPGVLATTVGYTGGRQDHPSYEEVSAGKTGHAEAIQVTYDPSKVTYAQLLDVFWRQIDPTTPNRQFADVGTQYRTAIFYHDEAQHRLAIASQEQLERDGRYGKPIVTEIVPASAFYPAEAYHQQYYKKNPIRYKLYRIGSGRDRYLNAVWGK